MTGPKLRVSRQSTGTDIRFNRCLEQKTQIQQRDKDMTKIFICHGTTIFCTQNEHHEGKLASW